MDDLISREAAKDAIRRKFPNLADRCEINEVLNGLPTAPAIPIAPLCEYLASRMTPPAWVPARRVAWSKEQLIEGWECVISEFLRWEGEQHEHRENE